MKPRKALLIVLFFVFCSCNKDEVRSNGITNGALVRKMPPIAEAGENVTLILPQFSTNLDATASGDSDGTIISYQWKQITGPSICVIEEPHNALTEVNIQRVGTYEFELSVMDNDGLSSKDVKLVKLDPPQQEANEIVATLQWDYDANKKRLAAKLADLDDPGNHLSADSIKAVYQFFNGSYLEIPRGTPGNPGGVFYEIEEKTLLLCRAFQPSSDNNLTISVEIAVAVAEGGLQLPHFAKVVFQ